MTIDDIKEGCRLGGCSLEQRLAVVSFSSIPHQQREAELIIAYLAQRRIMLPGDASQSNSSTNNGELIGGNSPLTYPHIVYR